jgi:glycosyltransferase involved in cell wall biosynthesis
MFEGLMRTCSAAVAITHFIADSLPDAGRHGRRRAHISVISDAVEPDRFDPAGVEPRAARSSLGIPLDAPVLAIAGQISPHKGQSDAIEILARVKATQPAAQLLVAGSVKFASKATRFDNRAYEEDLFALVKQASLTDSVHFLGERDDLAEVLAAADVILVPSWYEPLGLVAIEAMMMERPVIATAVGGTREVVRDGQDGLVLAPRDPEGWARAVSGLLNDPDLRSAMGTSGRLRAIEEFSPALHASRVTSVYERVLGSTGTGGSTDW